MDIIIWSYINTAQEKIFMLTFANDASHRTYRIEDVDPTMLFPRLEKDITKEVRGRIEKLREYKNTLSKFGRSVGL